MINLGSNRWTFRPQLGVSRAIGSWTLEAAATAWLFTDNDNAVGARLEQKPLYALQGHVHYRFANRVTVGLGAGYADGGLTTVDGVERSSIQSNSRLGAVLSLPFGRRHGVSVTVTSGLTTRIGSDFDTYTVAYSYLWGI